MRKIDPRHLAPVLLGVSLCGWAPSSWAQQGAPAPEPSPSPSPYRHAETVVVQAIRAEAQAPVTKKDLDRHDLARLDRGQEMPFLLQEAPSLTYYSDSGLGAGYSYFSIRGIQQTRINMTLDGAPLNEAEDSAVYFADFAGFAGALDSIQIQRGVGTSSVGSASFGGSVNFASRDPEQEPALAAGLRAGSFGTRQGSLDLHSGRLRAGFALYGRAAYQETDGFREHSGVRQRTAFFGATRLAPSSLFKLSGFTGRERTQLAFLASEQDVLERNLRDNPLDPAERDRFGQDFVQAQYTRFLGSSASLAVQGYYNGAGGWYRLWEDPARLRLLEYSLDWALRGGLLTFDLVRGRLDLTAGLHANDFDSEHAQHLVGGARSYQNRGLKSEASGFLKLAYDPGRFRLYADAQLRHARFRYRGDVELGKVSWTFFNPKLGLRYELASGTSLYASVGRGTREPTRMDLLAGEDDATLAYDLRAVKPERLLDFEGGLDHRSEAWELHATLYAMEFRNEIALSGELSEIGLPLRRNVGRSHRRGLELDLAARLAPGLRVRGSAQLSRGRISEWTQFYDVYDESGASLEGVERRHRDVRPLLTPALTANLGVEWTRGTSSRVALAARYVSRAALDNTGVPGFETPAFFQLDASAGAGLGRWLRVGEPRLRLDLENLLDDRRIWPSGYSYLFFVRDPLGRERLSGMAYYYPLASRRLFVSLEFRL